MKIRFRILLGFALIFVLSFCFLILWTLTEVNIQPKKSMEESLVDMSHILASYLEQRIKDSNISIDELKIIFNNAEKREFSAQIYELKKETINLRIYVMDKNGIVIFDSDNGKEVGEDFSDWNDVRKTFNGEYGARTTRTSPEDPLSSVAYISAPIYKDGELFGVCSIAKPWKSIHSFTQTTQRKFIIAGIIGFIIILILSYFISFWITRPIWKLTHYTNSVKDGKRETLPDLGKGEIKVLGESFEKMRESLEGKKYIEKYIQNLTHQIKGPISSIKGAAELLQEELPSEDRIRFISNIEKENARIGRIVDRLLQLSSIEKRRGLQNIERIDFKDIILEILESISPILKKKRIKCLNKMKESYFFMGEKFLMIQAISNLFQNAVDFTPEKGEIIVSLEKSKHDLILKISDNGTGIPDYALSKVFDKFYSLPRPESGQKSSGLGLSMVKEVAKLHEGNIYLKNNENKGVIAIFIVPCC